MKFTGNRKHHYAWFILAGCCMMQGAGLGLINNCAGVFYSPVCEDLGFEMGQFTLYRTFFSISSALALPFVASCLRRFDIRLVLSLAAAVFGGSTMAMGLFSELYQWYIAGMIQGASSSFICMMTAPIILGNWFYKRTGTAVGISAAFSGLVGMMGSSFLGFTIPALGWRISYLIVGGVGMAVIIFAAVFVIRYKPEDLNLFPYGLSLKEMAGMGEQQKQKEKLPGLGQFLREPMFYVATLAYACSIASSYFNMFLTSCGLAVGLPMAAAAFMTTLGLMGNMLSKLVLGKATDSYGAIRVLQASVLLSVAGYGLLYLGVPSGMMAGSLLFGLVPPMSSVLMPLYCRLFWKGDAYAVIYSYISMFGTLISSPFNMLFGQLYDKTGTYQASIALGAVLVMAVFLLISAGKQRKNS